MVLLQLFRKFLRRTFAKYLLEKMKVNLILNKQMARKWNHLQAIIITNGDIKVDWDVIRGIDRLKCHRCLKHLNKTDVEHCSSCKKILKAKTMW